jgi:hypothetical protein
MCRGPVLPLHEDRPQQVRLGHHADHRPSGPTTGIWWKRPESIVPRALIKEAPSSIVRTGVVITEPTCAEK